MVSELIVISRCKHLCWVVNHVGGLSNQQEYCRSDVSSQPYPT